MRGNLREKNKIDKDQNDQGQMNFSEEKGKCDVF